MFITKNKYIFIAISIILIVVSVALVYSRGMKYGIDFTGGTIAEVQYPQGRPEIDLIKAKVSELNLGDSVVQTIGSNGILLRMRTVNDSERLSLTRILSFNSTSTVISRFDSIGPVIGSELKSKALWAIALVILLIVIYITFVFRHVSRPVSSWKYGVIAIITLVHDVIVPTGFFVAYGGEVDVLFATAILAILGFSVHDTIVVFDRVRENLKHAAKNEAFPDTVGKSVGQTFARSLNTSLTVVLVLLALYFAGGETTKDFALLLIVGIVAGTYSSIFFASPLLVMFEKWQKKTK